MENDKLIILSQLIEKKINKRNEYAASANCVKSVLKYYDDEISLLESLLFDIVEFKKNLERKFYNERMNLIKSTREQAFLEFSTGRQAPLNIFSSY